MEHGSQSEQYTILALYKFVSPKWRADEVAKRRDEIESFLRLHIARGAILVSVEGINGTICYPSFHSPGIPYNEKFDLVFQFFTSMFAGLRTRVSTSQSNVFFRLRVRVKQEIVTMGVDGVCPIDKVGEYIPPGPEWNKLLADPDCLVIDTRNDYEYEIGTFKSAVNPNTKSFTELPKWLEDNVKKADKKPSKIAMFCTGGIRCEKSTSYALDLFKEEQIPVFHLEGGVLAYLDIVPPEQSLFEGECYVFDQRIAVTHGLRPSENYVACHACRHPLSASDREHEDFKQDVQCGFCVKDEDRQARRHRYEARHYQMKVHEEKGIPHMYDNKEISKYCFRSSQR
jgi:UPF0176 protein